MHLGYRRRHDDESLRRFGGRPLMALPLQCGDRGEEVRDIHRRLAAAGFAVAGDELAEFTGATRTAVEAFQRSRGLETTGACDAATWQLLVEAGYRLGDRLLYLHAPMLRGDDVADLQLRLGSLGFDAGRIDGIFGIETERALAEFQRNVGLPTDGIAGRATVGELARLGALSGPTAPVATVREHELLRHAPRQLHGRRMVVGELGGLAALATATARLLRHAGGRVLTLHQPDGSSQAAGANQFEAELFLGLAPLNEPGCTIAYFATTGWESSAGRHLASLCATELAAHLAPTAAANDTDPNTTVDGVSVDGMRLPILRETRMPAVLCRIGPPELVVARTAELAQALAQALTTCATTPVEP